MAAIGPKQAQRSKQAAKAVRPAVPASGSHPALLEIVRAMARDAVRLELARQKTDAEASDPLSEA